MLLLLMASARIAQNNSIQSCTRREKKGKKKPGISIDAGRHSFTAGPSAKKPQEHHHNKSEKRPDQ
jgi:hypothetical protein